MYNLIDFKQLDRLEMNLFGIFCYTLNNNLAGCKQIFII